MFTTAKSHESNRATGDHTARCNHHKGHDTDQIMMFLKSHHCFQVHTEHVLLKMLASPRSSQAKNERIDANVTFGESA